ncbi:glycosyl transferase [Shimazuella sp. AN120528]|uniref:macrolide family glycosyltransferase n=1 Tax=Shimazuella soli TaxID=1892854 RepID=UPI001F11299B|nr:glycosyl transferase [Shimazuella soli]
MFIIAKVLVVNYLGEGHVNPSIGLIKELVQRGEQVTYYTSDLYKEKLQQTGAEFRPISMKAQALMKELVANFQDHKNKSPVIGNMDKMMQSMEWITDEILADIQNEVYDYVIFDAQSFPGKWVADIKKLPSYALWSTFASSEKTSFFKKVMEKWSPEMKEQFLAKQQEMEQITKRLEQKYGVPIPSFLTGMVVDAELHIIFTSRLFQPESEHYNENYVFVGPSVTDRPEQLDFPIEEIQNRRVVYMALGTIVNKRVDLYQMCIEALKDLDVKVVLSIGNYLSPDDIGSIPDNFIVRNYVPQLEVLNHSDVFITHCGMNSTNEGLYFGNALVMLPLVNDQPVVAERVEKLGAGLLLDPQNLDADTLRKSVLEALNNPVYKENSLKISRSFQKAGGYVKAVDELLKSTRKKTTNNL